RVPPMTRKISQIAMFIALLGALWSCGDETPDEKSCLRDPSAVSATPFVEATPAQLQEGQALVGSYLVAFRSELGGPGLRHPSFAAEHRAFHGFLTERIGHDPRV